MLSKKHLRFLKRISKKPTPTIELKPFAKSNNIDYKFLEDIIDLYEITNDEYNNHIFQINQKGMAVLENHRRRFRAEIRNWITTAIAVAAFIKSFFF